MKNKQLHYEGQGHWCWDSFEETLLCLIYKFFGDGLRNTGFSRTLGSVVKNAETGLTKLS